MRYIPEISKASMLADVVHRKVLEGKSINCQNIFRSSKTMTSFSTMAAVGNPSIKFGKVCLVDLLYIPSIWVTIIFKTIFSRTAYGVCCKEEKLFNRTCTI